jgi:hypothetical protein
VPSDMNALLRGKRKELDAYMYPAEGEATPESSDAPTEDVAAMTLKAPGEERDPAMWVYEQNEAGGWVMYPPDVPCPTESSRVEIDHPATEAELTEMAEMLGGADEPPAEDLVSLEEDAS